MEHVIHIYLGTAVTTETCNSNYPIGEKHAFLLYLKATESSDYNVDEAELTVSDLGFTEIVFDKVGLLSPEKINTDEKKEYFDNAMNYGFTFVLYKHPIV
jgi:hypothetical protein